MKCDTCGRVDAQVDLAVRETGPDPPASLRTARSWRAPWSRGSLKETMAGSASVKRFRPQKRDGARPMRIERRNTTAGQSPYAGIDFRLTTSEIRNPDGSVLFP